MSVRTMLAALWHDRRGTSLIEMGFLVPVMVLLACMAADLGSAFLSQIRIQQAAARTMEMALAYKLATVPLSTSVIDAEGAAAYGLPSDDPNNQVTADMWMECTNTSTGVRTRASSYTDTCAAGSTPARFASVAITDTYNWTFEAVTRATTPYSINLRGFAEVRLQ